MAFVGKVEEDEVEDAGELKFPKEFKAAQFLTNAEADLFLTEAAEIEGSKTTEQFKQAHAYVKLFNGGVDEITRSKAAVEEIKQSLLTLTFSQESEDGTFVDVRLHPWEVVSLANLVPHDEDEAVTHIPSLGRFGGDDIKKVLTTLEASMARLRM